jgi:hypothetical protein
MTEITEKMVEAAQLECELRAHANSFAHTIHNGIGSKPEHYLTGKAADMIAALTAALQAREIVGEADYSELIDRLRQPVMLHSNAAQTNAERLGAAEAIESLLQLISLQPDYHKMWEDNAAATAAAANRALIAEERLAALQARESVGAIDDPLAIERLIRWRDVGDGPATYTAGSKQFGDDVIVLLSLLQSKPADEWRTIESAPKDGSWFLAYRPAPEIGTWERLVAVRWFDDGDNLKDFIWSDHHYSADPFTKSCDDDDWIKHGDFYEGRGTFTHWCPLPAAPEPKPGERSS